MEKKQEKWYFRTWTLVVSFLLVGPFMLPLVWVNPHFSKKVKISITAVVIILTCFLGALFFYSLKWLIKYYKTILQGFS
jgi:hypothetical protein